jgi:GNAT superfamily N-acetyltransferase
VQKKFFIVQDKIDLERCYPVIKELRPHLDFTQFLDIYECARAADGYEIVACEVQGQIVAVMGYRFLWDFVRGKHVYVDDLVSAENHRSFGYGSELLKFAETIAKKAGCKALRLCTGIENELGIKFYDRNGWTKRAFAYVKKIN